MDEKLQAADDTAMTAVEPASNLQIAHASATERKISGCILPFGDAGNTTAGELVFANADAITVPSDISRVKLLDGHAAPDGTCTPVGVMTSCEARKEGLFAEFTIGSGPAGDKVLASAREHIVDSFSIEAKGIIREGGGRNVRRSVLTGVAMVPFPAFSNARVQRVTAQDASQKEEKKEDTTAQAGTMRGLVTPTGGAKTESRVKAALSDAIQILADAAVGRRTRDSVYAELVDITQTGMLDGIQPEWVGELWNGVPYTREIVNLLTSAELKGPKAVGYRWKTKPTMAKWEGDKKPIHSSKAEVEQVTVDATYWAGGNDIDRRFWDFGQTELLAAYWAAMAESYAIETDKDTGAWLVTEAAKQPAITAPDALRAATRGALQIRKNVRCPASFVLVSIDDIESLMTFTRLDMPEYMNLTPVSDPSTWTASEFVEKGTMIVGCKQAATFYELGGGAPIRVEAENIAKGGRDIAGFGYTARILNRPDGLVKVSIQKPVGP